MPFMLTFSFYDDMRILNVNTHSDGAQRDTLSERSPSSAPRLSWRLTPQISVRTTKRANKATQVMCTLARIMLTPGNRQG